MSEGQTAPPPLPKSQPSFGKRNSTIIKLLGVGLALAVGSLVDARGEGQQLFLFSPRLLGFSLGFSVVLGALAATYATLRIVRLSPAEAIRRGA
jgi:ABC-type antimicrobial peptide transport system permease subunit